MSDQMTPELLAAIEPQARKQAAGHRAGSEKARQLVAIIALLRAAEAERDRLRAALERIAGNWVSRVGSLDGWADIVDQMQAAADAALAPQEADHA